MDQEKTVHFSIVKQKIIKTDEVLRMYIDVSNKLKKAQQACKEIKLQYDQMVSNNSRIKLEHERCTFNIENLKQRNNILDKENRYLQEQKSVLEEQYNQQTVQSQLNIKHLEEELQSLHKNYARENWLPKKKRTTVKVSEKKIENDISHKNHLKLTKNLTTDILNGKGPDFDNDMFACDAPLLKNDNQSNPKEEYIRYSAPNETTDGTINEEYEVTLIFDNTKEDNIFNKKNRCTEDIGTQTQQFKIERSVHIQTVETIKSLELNDKILSENKQLKQRILECDAEIMKLQTKEKIIQKSCSIQTEEMEVEDELVEGILNEMLMPRILSPMSPITNINLSCVDTFSPKPTDVRNSALPEIVVIPPTPVKKSIEVDFDKKQENTDLATDGKSSEENDKVCLRNSKHSKRYKYRSPVISNDFVNTFVKFRKKYINRLTKKRYILNKEIKKIRKLRKEDYLLKTLCTLKRLNINFTISNDSILPKFHTVKKNENFDYSGSDHTERKIPAPIRKSETNLTEQLNCICTKCNQSSMLLSKVSGETHLLGFYSIKNEVNTPISSRMEDNWDTKLFHTIKLSNSSLNESDKTPESVLEMLAEIVSKKLNKRKESTTITKGMISDQYDTFDSETETEIERLFNKSNTDILKRNKMLLEAAKKQYQISNPSAADKFEQLSSEIGVSFDSGINLPDEEVSNFRKPLHETKELENHVPPQDSACSGNENDAESCDFEFPSYPKLLSPIKSLKGVDISKTEHESNSLYTYENISSCQNFNEINEMLCKDVQNISNAISPIKLYNDGDGLSNKEQSGENNELDSTFLEKEKQENCPTNANHNSIVTAHISGDRNNKQKLNIQSVEEIEHSQYHRENVSQFPEETEDETAVKNLNSTLLSDTDIMQSCSPSMKCKKNQQNDTIPLKDGFPNCPASPIPDNINVRVPSPILIPLEKLEGDMRNCELHKECDTLSSSVAMLPKCNLMSTPQKLIRRSKRISQKKSCSKSTNCDLNVVPTNKVPTSKLNSDPHPLSYPPLEESSKVVSQNDTGLVNVPTENFKIDHTDESKRTTVTKSNSKRSISKLKSNILKQVRVKREIFRTTAECHMLKVCDNKPPIRHGNSAIQDKRKVTKIHIVQNILIPANSDQAVDLLTESEHGNFNSVVENCDIRLNNKQNSSQSNTASSNCANKKKIDNNICDVPHKKKRVERTKMECDLLSQIIKEMDKDRPEIILKAKKQLVDSKEMIPDSTDEKQWRKGVLVIAENIHNISSKPIEPTEHINKNKVFNPKSKTNAKRKILISRLLKLSSEEKIPDEIIVEFKRHDVDSIAEMILQKVSLDIWDKPDVKYYPAPLMTKTQRILLGLMVRLEQENMEKVMDTFISKVEAFLFKIGCGIRTLIPIVRLYMAVCKLRRDIDKMRNFCCDAFLFMDDLAVPLFFTVLTSWTEVLPMESELKNYPLAKTLIQVVHLKICKKPGYNLLPLKCLFSQFYGYPKERWNCDEIFDELCQQYLRSPDKSSDIAIRLLCKHKDTKWVYTKVNEFFKPLIYKIPSENVNFKATVIILIGKLCRRFKRNNEFDESSLKDLRRWLIGLTEDEDVHELITKSVDLSISKLPKKMMRVKKANNRKIINKPNKNNKAKKCKKIKLAVVK